jgi:flagellar protein FlbD
MIKVSLMNGSEIVLNSDLIEFVEATPDTVISLSTGKKVMVHESVSEVLDRVIEFRRRLGGPAANLQRSHTSSDDDSSETESQA